MWMLGVVGRGGMVWLVAGAVIAWRRSSRRDFVALALSLLLATIVADRILKPAVGRMRPFDRVPAVRVIGGRPNDSSFPSGHAANAFAGALVLTTTVPNGALVWWPLAIAIAYSRVYLGVHYPLDVVGGGLVGLACAACVVAVQSRFAARFPASK